MNYWMKSSDISKAKPHTLCGIPGHLIQVAGADGLWERQEFFASREFKKEGGRFDICIAYERGHPSNKANHFSMRYNFDGVSGPLGIEEAVKFWPEIAHLVKWHLCADGVPMYYIENTLYRAAVGDLELARKTALWLDAPEHLMLGAPVYLEVALRERLPALQQKFRDDLAATGLKLHP